MSQTVEVDLGAILQRIEQNQIELKVGLARLEGEVQNIKATLSGKIDTLQVEVQNIKEENKEIRSDIKGRVSIQTYWLLVLITFLIGVVGKFAFFPKA